MGERHNLVRHKLRFIVCAVTSEADNLIAATEVGEQVLCFAIKVVADDSIGRIQNVLGGTIVLLQQNDFRAREIPFKLGDVANIGTTEGIN